MYGIILTIVYQQLMSTRSMLATVCTRRPCYFEKVQDNKVLKYGPYCCACGSRTVFNNWPKPSYHHCRLTYSRLFSCGFNFRTAGAGQKLDFEKLFLPIKKILCRGSGMKIGLDPAKIWLTKYLTSEKKNGYTVRYHGDCS